METKRKYREGQNVWILRNGEPCPATITGILVDNGGWCYEYTMKIKIGGVAVLAYSGGCESQIYGTRKDAEMAFLQPKKRKKMNG